MTAVLPDLRVGPPLRYKSLTVFPLFSPAAGETPPAPVYRLSAEALAAETVKVSEISEAGAVPSLLVDNLGDVRVLFLEGEELVGAKQNRVLNTSLLAAAGTRTKVPVSCVERGRWGYRSRGCGSSGSHSPSGLRRALKASVSRSARVRGGHASDQGEVWRQVDLVHKTCGVESSTSALADAYDANRGELADLQGSLPYVPGAVGLAAAVGGKIVSLDFFDRPETCAKVWSRLLSGFLFDALERPDSGEAAPPAAVESLLAAARGFAWATTPAVGEGEERRAESPQGDHASLLILEGTVVHGSLVTAA